MFTKKINMTHKIKKEMTMKMEMKIQDGIAYEKNAQLRLSNLIMQSMQN